MPKRAAKKNASKPARPRLPKLDFDAVLASIQPVEPKSIIRPDEEWLAHFERVYRIALPLSYLQFIRRFGAGELSGCCRIYAAGPSIVQGDLFHWNQVHWENMAESAGGRDFDYTSLGIVLFGHIWSHDNYGFNRREITQNKPREYAIYTVSRHFELVQKVADSFPQFISEFCLGDGLVKFCEHDQFDRPRTEYKLMD